MLRLFSALSVCVCLTVSNANAQPKQVAPSPALQAEFDAFIPKFRAALKANDGAAVTALTKFPFYYNDAQRDSAYFRSKVYAKIFTGSVRNCIQRTKATYDKDQLGAEHFLFFCGQLIVLVTKTPQGILFSETGVND